MASVSSSTKNSTYHTRSISLPSTLHKSSPFDKLYQEATTYSSSSSSSSSIIGHKVNGLNDMFESIETLLSTQRLLGDGCHKEEINGILDELLVLLDLCSTTKDALCMSMDAAKELQSVFRRKRGDGDGLISSVRQYLSERKNVKNLTQKAISRLKKQSYSPIKEKGTTTDINLLKDVGSNTLMMLESLMTFIQGSYSLSRPMVWFSVSKILCNKRVQCNQMLEKDEMKKVDDEIIALFSHKGTNKGIFDVEIMYKSLSELEFSLQNLHEHVECLFRHLIKTRVCLLNKLTC
uniref:uncharacterized protein LOC122596912 n=1 Tax=Erigeron canadensis TaxID=72917 RepID=UPI001CB8F170|nr:uncharacterized protein LOC122596912 [Erigeron canadensis]